jgi:hypothetical protein
MMKLVTMNGCTYCGRIGFLTTISLRAGSRVCGRDGKFILGHRTGFAHFGQAQLGAQPPALEQRLIAGLA